MEKDVKKVVAIESDAWKILKQFSLDMDLTMGKILSDLVREHLR